MAVYLRAPAIGRPPPVHTMTESAELGREGVRRYAEARNAKRLRGTRDEIATGPHPRAEAQRVEVGTLTGSPKTTAAKLEALGARVAVTIAASGAACSVWALTPDGRRVRAFYRRTISKTTGAPGWASDGASVDGIGYGITAALGAVAAPRAV